MLTTEHERYTPQYSVVIQKDLVTLSGSCMYIYISLSYPSQHRMKVHIDLCNRNIYPKWFFERKITDFISIYGNANFGVDKSPKSTIRQGYCTLTRRWWDGW